MEHYTRKAQLWGARRHELDELDLVIYKIRQEVSATYPPLIITSGVYPQRSGTPQENSNTGWLALASSMRASLETQ